GELLPAQHVTRLVLQVRRRDPHPCPDRAEAEPGQPGPQRVTTLPLGLGHAEDDEDPALVDGALATAEDPAVTLVEDDPSLRGQGITCPAVDALGLED